VGDETVSTAQIANQSGWARSEGGTPGATRPASPYPRILFPTNLSQLSVKTVPYISLLAQRFGAQVTVLHVLPDDEASTADEFSKNDETRNQMALQFNAFRPFRPEFIVARGNTAETVLRVAREKQTGLIAMAIRNAFRPGILRERTAYRIIAGAQCPVLTVR
jgi:nucleotide-binding universal stress UspA family protein